MIGIPKLNFLLYRLKCYSDLGYLSIFGVPKFLFICYIYRYGPRGFLFLFLNKKIFLSGLIGSGVCLLSKHPILSTEQHRFTRNGYFYDIHRYFHHFYQITYFILKNKNIFLKYIILSIFEL